MSSIKLITHVEDIFYHLKSSPPRFLHSKDIVIDNVHMQDEKKMLLVFRSV